MRASIRGFLAHRTTKLSIVLILLIAAASAVGLAAITGSVPKALLVFLIIVALAPAIALAGIAVIATLNLPVLVHELGHVGAGLLVGFEFNVLEVGPIGVRKTAFGFRTYHAGTIWKAGGYAAMLPKPGRSLVLRHNIMIAGGPVASAALLTGVILLDRIWWPYIADWWTNPLEVVLLFVTLLALACCLTIIPHKSKGYYSDGAKLVLCLFSRGFARYEALRSLLAADVQRGTRARDLSEQVLQELRRTWHSAEATIVSSVTSYYHYLDKGDPQEAITLLMPAYELVKAKPYFVISHSKLVCLETAYISALLRDLGTAKRAFEQAGSFPIAGGSVEARAQAAMFACEGNREQAERAAAVAEATLRAEADMSLPRNQAELNFIHLALTAGPGAETC